MPSKPQLYRRLIRLREKRKRIERQISNLERKLDGKCYYWGACSRGKKR